MQSLPPYHPRQILIKPAPGANLLALRDFHAIHGMRIIREFPRLGNIQVLELPSGEEVISALSWYRQSRLIQYAEPDYALSAALSPNDPNYAGGDLWFLHNTGQNGGVADADIDAPEGWDIQNNASNVIVAVIDSGVRYTHQDLAANMWINPGEIPGNGIDDDGNGFVDDVHGINVKTNSANSGNPADDFGHGTQVAGVIGGIGGNGLGGLGVAWRVQLMACRYQDSSGQGFVSDAVQSFEYAREKGANIINASFVTASYSSTLYDAIKACRDADILVVAAAGNDTSNNDSSPRYPASYDLDNIIAVAATTRTDGWANFSNFGTNSVDLAAPGSGIFTTANESDSSYATVNGTSFSAPIVAGALALLKVHAPAESYRQLINRLFAGVDGLPSLVGKCATGGRLNLRNSLALEVVAGFSVGSATIALGDAVQFTDVSSGTITNWSWSFGDGGHSSEANPAHDYLTNGEFLVSLTVTDNLARSSQYAKQVTVVPGYAMTSGTFNWINPSSMTALALDCFSVSSAQALPFSFKFFGATYSQISIGDGGIIGFDSFAFQPTTDLPSTDFPNNIICPFWDLLTPCEGGTVYVGTVGQSPNRKVVVSWVLVARLLNSEQPFTFQVWLEENSQRIQFQYQSVENGTPEEGASGALATIGLEQSSGQVAARYSYQGSALVANGQAILFTPLTNSPLNISPALGLVSSGPVGGPFAPVQKTYTLTNSGGSSLNWSAATSQPWLTLSATAGTLTPGGSTNLTLSLNAQAHLLAAGVHLGGVRFTNLSNGNGNIHRSVSLNVGATFGLEVSPENLSRWVGHVGGPFSPTNQVYTLTNSGGTALAWSAASTSSWLALSPTNGSLATGATATVTAFLNQPTSFPLGTNSAEIAFFVPASGSNLLTRLSVLEVYPFQLSVPAMLEPSGEVQLNLRAVPGWTYVLEASGNLSAWTAIATNVTSSVDGRLIFVDAAAGQFGPRFYRAVLAP